MSSLKAGMILLLLFVIARPARADPWPRHTIDASSRGADGVRLADVNGDGLMDIAVGWEEGGIVRAYIHPGRGKERAPWPKVTVGQVKSPEDAVFVDVDADGIIDVVSCCEGKTRTVFIHWAPSSPEQYLQPHRWSTAAVSCTKAQQMWMYAVPLQVDGLHGVDLVVGSKGENGSVGWLRAPANPRDTDAWQWFPLQQAGWIMSLIPADVDSDGDLDIVVSDRKGKRRGVYWLEYPGAVAAAHDSPWQRHDVGGGDREILFLALEDLDQDRRDDLVAIDRKEIIWFRASSEGWQEHSIPLPEGVGTGKSAAVGDLDGDGRRDLVFSCENAHGDLSGMRWLSYSQSPAAGIWTSHEIGGPLGVKYDRVVLYDVDGDKDLDVLCCEERDQLGVFWYENVVAVN